MSQKELLESLRRQTEERIAALWRQAEAEAAELRARAADGATEHPAEPDPALPVAEDQTCRDLRRQERRLRLEADQAIGERLWQLARRLLPKLPGLQEPELFATLAAELPAADWGEIRVHPRNLAQAKTAFPNATVTVDEKISGGLAALSRDGGLRVDNTLEKRLERAWPDLLPQLRKEAYALLDAPGAAGVP